MIRKTLLGVLAVVGIVAAGLWVLGQGLLGQFWHSSAVVVGPRPAAVRDLRKEGQQEALARLVDGLGTGYAPTDSESPSEILFGDLHAHTSFSVDAALFGLPMITGSAVMMPSDACDFARYCSALDFWSINDHAEGMTPRSWQDSVNAIRDCNAQAGDPRNPDMVSFVGWEWSQGADSAEGHYGHKNVIFREWEKGRAPTRPISSQKVYTIVEMIPAIALGGMSLNRHFGRYQDFARYVQESAAVPACAEGSSASSFADTVALRSVTAARRFTCSSASSATVSPRSRGLSPFRRRTCWQLAGTRASADAMAWPVPRGSGWSTHSTQSPRAAATSARLAGATTAMVVAGFTWRAAFTAWATSGTPATR